MGGLVSAIVMRGRGRVAATLVNRNLLGQPLMENRLL